MKILLVGAGNMGEAMLARLDKYDVTVVEKHKPRTDELKGLYPNISILDSLPSLDGYIVILAIKPQSLNKLDTYGEADAVISILAGISISKIKQKVSAKAYIRAMPNIAALKGKSITSVCGDEIFKNESMQILSSIGKVVWLDSQEQLDIATGIGGSAPAWLALVAEALSDGAVNIGLPRDKSYKYISGLFEGMGAILEDEHPALIKDKVTSPSGTTIAGLAVLEEGAVRDSFIKAVKVCYDRTKEL